MYLTKLLLPACVGLCAMATPAFAAEKDEVPPARQALEEFREGPAKTNPVLNRYFLKAKRFELTPGVGLVPNNPFARRFTVSLGFGYHFTEQLAVSGFFSFAPDLGERDLKSLTALLLDFAEDEDFEQPIDKVTLAANFGVKWAPIYGKINLAGETVLNFDFYGFLGIGMVVQNEYRATENPNATSVADFSLLSDPITQVRIAPTIAVGGNFFLTQGVALNLDGRFALYPDNKPDYDLTDDEVPEGLRVVTMFTASAGVSFFFPKMKPRLYDF